jgi:hypothetical protein
MIIRDDRRKRETIAVRALTAAVSVAARLLLGPIPIAAFLAAHFIKMRRATAIAKPEGAVLARTLGLAGD